MIRLAYDSGLPVPIDWPVVVDSMIQPKRHDSCLDQGPDMWRK